MSLNTFWLHRKTQQRIEGTHVRLWTHWFITKYTRHYEGMTWQMQYEEARSMLACIVMITEIPGATIEFNAWASADDPGRDSECPECLRLWQLYVAGNTIVVE